MHLMRFMNTGMVLAALASAAPDAEVTNYTSPTAASTSLPEPDPRFAHASLAHPYAQIHVPHPTDLARLSALKTNNSDISRRDSQQVYGVYECSKRHFQGTCHWQQIIHNEKKCYRAKYSWPGGSLGPDKGVSCVAFSIENCNYRQPWAYPVQWPGVPDPADNPFYFNQAMDLGAMSYTCDWGT